MGLVIMATNPVLYNIQNLQQGRSTGTFRGVRQAPQLSDVATQRSALIGQYNTDLEGASKEAVTKQTAYETLSKQIAAQVAVGKGTYESTTKSLQDKMAASLTKYTDTTKSASGTVATDAQKAAYTNEIAQLNATIAEGQKQLKMYPSSYLYSSSSDGYTAALKRLPVAQFEYSKLTSPTGVDAGELAKYQELVRKGNAQISSAMRYPNAEGSNQFIRDGQQLVADGNAGLAALTAAANKPQADAYAAYRADAEAANAAQKAAHEAYTKLIENSNSTQKASYTDTFGQLDKVQTEFKDRRASIEGLGYLAQKSIAPDAVSPDVSTGATLAATDLYSNDLAAQISGRQKSLQATPDAPEDDLVTGALQSSLYSKR